MDPLRAPADEGLAGHGAPAGPGTASAAVPFGKPMRALFSFAPTYRNLNHGSYGTFPAALAAVRLKHLAEHEARAEVHKRFSEPKLIVKSREALLPLLGPDVHLNEVVLVTNATTGVNVVLRNLAARWSAPGPNTGDAVLYLKTTYEACNKTLQDLESTGRLHPVEVRASFPADDDDAVVQKLRDAHAAATARGLTVRLALFDTVVSFPGVLLPWERLTAACRDLGILSLVDAAHAVGHLDLTELGRVRPDFFVSNCHKWLFVPRSCAVLYVPFRNQHHIETCLPTSWGYRLPQERGGPEPPSAATPSTYFAGLFAEVGTMDYSPWMCVPDAIRFRETVCGGEAAIRTYCFDLARTGTDRVAAILGTEVMDNPRSGLRACGMANVRLPFAVAPDADIANDDAATVPLSRFNEMLTWMATLAKDKYDTYFRIEVYEGHAWVRLSAQVYLDQDDFEWAGHALLDLCERIRQGEWKTS